MAVMTILEAAEYFGISKEAIHNRVRRGSLVVTLVEGVKMVEVDANAPKTASKPRASRAKKTTAQEVVDDRYYKFLEEQNAQLQVKVDKLEGETRSLRDQKEDMLIQERIKIEQIYKDKDEQLKNLLTTISSQFMLHAPISAKVEPIEVEHVEVEVEEVIIEEKKVLEESFEEEEEKKGELVSLKKYLKNNNFSERKREKIKAKFQKKAKKDERIITLGSKYYLDTFKYDYSDLLK